MSTTSPPSLLSRGMLAVLVAQFLSAASDNALLFATLALLKSRQYPAWTDPLLQEFFVAAYIILAPFTGPLADGISKGRAMLIANGVKLLGSVGICLGWNPFLAYGLVGIGAAAYSPAKYGILSELTTAQHLVRANSMMEGSTIAAILVGAVAGGILADWSISGALWIVAGGYALAAATNLLIPPLPPLHVMRNPSFSAILKDFAQVTLHLVRLPDARFSILGTSLFWGIGATMRFLLIAWVPVALGIASNRMPAYLNAMTAIGIVIGAAIAGKWISVENARRVLPSGVLLGLAVCTIPAVNTLPMACVLLTLIGAAGGLFIVPLNALLQDRGHSSVGTGHAIAIQNLGENLMMLLMIGIYALLVHADVGVNTIAVIFGAALAIAITALKWAGRAAPPASAPAGR